MRKKKQITQILITLFFLCIPDYLRAVEPGELFSKLEDKNDWIARLTEQESGLKEKEKALRIKIELVKEDFSGGVFDFLDRHRLEGLMGQLQVILHQEEEIATRRRGFEADLEKLETRFVEAMMDYLEGFLSSPDQIADKDRMNLKRYLSAWRSIDHKKRKALELHHIVDLPPQDMGKSEKGLYLDLLARRIRQGEEYLAKLKERLAYLNHKRGLLKQLIIVEIKAELGKEIEIIKEEERYLKAKIKDVEEYLSISTEKKR
ncbi:MAG: hypothetical protein QME81_03795 [bacterium]|nr:hypothetical protein [bacterium]